MSIRRLRVRGPFLTPRGVAGLVGVAFFIAYTWFSLAQWNWGSNPSWDLGIFTQAVDGYAHGTGPIVHIKGDGYNLLGDHFSPALVLLAPVFHFFPTPATLLVAQAFLVAVAVAVIAGDAASALGRWRGAVLGCALGLSFGVVQAVAVQFHEVALGAPLLATALVLARRERWTAAATVGSLLVFVKEDQGLTVAALGIVLLSNGVRAHGRFLMAWGAAWFLVTIGIMIPSLNSRGYALYASQIDGSTLVSQPWLALEWLVDKPEKQATLFLLLSITAFCCLGSRYLLLIVPTLLWRFWSGNPSYWGQGFHYDLLLMPIVFGAMTDALVRFEGRAWPPRRFTRIAPVVALGAAIAYFPQTHGTKLVNGTFAGTPPRAETRSHALALIPEGVTVETDIGLMNYLVPSRDVYYISNHGNPAPEFVVIDAIAGGWRTDPGSVAAYAEGRHPGYRYRPIFDTGGYRIARRE